MLVGKNPGDSGLKKPSIIQTPTYVLDLYWLAGHLKTLHQIACLLTLARCSIIMRRMIWKNIRLMRLIIQKSLFIAFGRLAKH